MDPRIPMQPKARGVTFGVGGMMIGAAAATFGSTRPSRLAVAVGVSVVVSLALVAATRNKLPA